MAIQDLLQRPDRAAPTPRKNLARLVGPEGWARLPAAVRVRFAADRRAADYEGEGQFETNWFGRLLALGGLMFGRPLPLRTGAAQVRIEVRATQAGEVWTRRYRFADGAEIVRSMKRAGAGDWLEEHAGALVMRLRVFEEDGVLVFDALGFELRFGALTIPLPVWATPGALRVAHHDHGGGRCAFTLEARHPWFGRTFRQHCAFVDLGETA